MKEIEMHKVSSSHIAEIGHSTDPQPTLRVKFTSGKTYVYHGISEALFKQLREAKSPGSFFNQHIKNNYKFEKQ